ncbi:MAG: hypothetical protein K2N24_02175, partial [Lachnospiraceae bacterium]|nr:hypothetical protein [Lachnospiraceae bacterium]
FIKSQTSKIRKIIGIIYFIFLSILAVFLLIQTLYVSNWSIIAHETLFNYTQYQLFMNVIMIAQWIGKKLFIK